MNGRVEPAVGQEAGRGDELVQEEPARELVPQWMRGGTGPPGSVKHAPRLGTDGLLEEVQEEPDA